MATKIGKPDPLAAHVALGRSNEELEAQQADFEQRVKEGKACSVSVISDEVDKRIDGDGDPGFDPLLEMDPMSASIGPYVEKGKAYKLLSPRCNEMLGGTRGYQVVKDEQGDPVKLGNMVWGAIPEKIARQRREALQREDLSKITDIQRTQARQAEDIIDRAKELGLTVLPPGETVQNIGDGGSYEMRITVERGDKPSA